MKIFLFKIDFRESSGMHAKYLRLMTILWDLRLWETTHGRYLVTLYYGPIPLLLEMISHFEIIGRGGIVGILVLPNKSWVLELLLIFIRGECTTSGKSISVVLLVLTPLRSLAASCGKQSRALFPLLQAFRRWEDGDALSERWA
jgi:hypothetical protein